MHKITILSPIHIGNGDKYANYQIIDGKKYTINSLLVASIERNRESLLSSEFLRTLASTNASNSNIAKDQIKKMLIPTPQELSKISYEYEVSKSTLDMKTLDVQEQIKTMGKTYIPGSTLKGFIMNVIMYDILRKCPLIRQKYTTLLSNKREEREYQFFAFTIANQQFICRDIEINCHVEINNISRISKPAKKIPILLECIPKNTQAESEFLSYTKKNLDTPKYESEILYNEIIQRIAQFKTKFPEMNKSFMLNAIQYQRAFILSFTENSIIDKENLLEQLSGIENALNKGIVIIQIGRLTNYITKSRGQAYGKDIYESKFYEYFNPGMRPNGKNKVAEPYKIKSMNLVFNSSTNLFDEIPGYIELSW